MVSHPANRIPIEILQVSCAGKTMATRTALRIQLALAVEHLIRVAVWKPRLGGTQFSLQFTLAFRFAEVLERSGDCEVSLDNVTLFVSTGGVVYPTAVPV